MQKALEVFRKGEINIRDLIDILNRINRFEPAGLRISEMSFEEYIKLPMEAKIEYSLLLMPLIEWEYFGTMMRAANLECRDELNNDWYKTDEILCIDEYQHRINPEYQKYYKEKEVEDV